MTIMQYHVDVMVQEDLRDLNQKYGVKDMKRFFERILIILKTIVCIMTVQIAFAKTIDLTVVISPTLLNCALQTNALLELKEKYPDQINLDIVFMIRQKNGNYESPFGKNDYDEAFRQMIIKSKYPEKYPAYIRYRNSSLYNPVWENSAVAAGIDVNIIKSELESAAPDKVWESGIKYFNTYQVKEVPTLIINGSVFCEGNAGLPEIENHIRILTGKSSPEFTVSLIIDPAAKAPVVQEYERHINRYIRGARTKKIPIDPEMEKEMKKNEVYSLPLALVDEYFLAGYNLNYMTDKKIKLGKYYVMDISGLKDTVIGRDHRPGHVMIYMQPHCGYASELLIKMIHVFKDNTNDLILDHPGFMIYKEQGNYVSAKGQAELEESIRQYAVCRMHPEKYWMYAKTFYGDSNRNWKIALKKSGLEKIEKEKKKNRNQYLEEMYQQSRNLPLNGSPTLVMDNQYIINDINAYLFKYKISIGGNCD